MNQLLLLVHMKLVRRRSSDSNYLVPAQVTMQKIVLKTIIVNEYLCHVVEIVSTVFNLALLYK